jgi:hypothetical protein
MTTSPLVPTHNYNTRFRKRVRKMVQESSIEPLKETITKNNSFSLFDFLMKSQEKSDTTSPSMFCLTLRSALEFSFRSNLDKTTRINTSKFIYDFILNNKQHVNKKLYTAMVDKLEELIQQGFPHEDYLYYVPKLEMLRKEKGF